MQHQGDGCGECSVDRSQLGRRQPNEESNRNAYRSAAGVALTTGDVANSSEKPHRAGKALIMLVGPVGLEPTTRPL